MMPIGAPEVVWMMPAVIQLADTGGTWMG